MARSLYESPGVSLSGGIKEDNTAYIYRGFSTVGGGRNFNLMDVDLIKQNLINMLHIRPGDLIGQPSFGCIAWDCLFEQLDDITLQRVGDNIASIINSDPRVSVNDISVERGTHAIKVSCDLTYIGTDVSERMEMDFDERNNIISR